MPDTSGKTNINVQEVKFIPITDEDSGTYDTTNAVDLTDRARSITYTPNVKKSALYGDGVIQEEVIDAETAAPSLLTVNVKLPVGFSPTSFVTSNSTVSVPDSLTSNVPSVTV